MNTAKENYMLLESIKIIIDRQTLQICSINQETQLYTGLNIFDFFKTFKPVFNEYPEFNAFLTQLKLYQRNPTLFTTNIINSFHNNFNFYNKISNNNRIQNNIKQFIITLIPNSDTTVLGITLNPKNNTAVIVLDAYGLPMNQNYDNQKIQTKIKNKPNEFEFDTDQLKHEIANSLNLINMSNILINNSFKNTDVEKYTNIISNELQNTANILNCANSSHLTMELITVKEFYGYINIFLEKLNLIYNITDDALIKFEPLTTDILNYYYLNINTSWFKIILDNIFKNIYGHIGDTHSLLLKSFNIYYNQELNKLCIDITNNKSNAIQTNTIRCKLYKQITDKYDLSHIPNIVSSIKRTNSQGLKLINILCEKQNIDWQLLELSDNEYVFKLSIPIYSYDIPLTLNSKPISNRDRDFGVTPAAVEFAFGVDDSIPVQTGRPWTYNLTNGCSLRDSALKISNIYLNETNRKTVI